jgi:hypothetical protein
MSIGWKLFRILCLLQMLATVYFAITSLIDLLQSRSFYFFFQAVAFALASSLAILGLNVVNNNYPDIPVAGTQKTIFNWLFLLNFLLLAFLFGLVIAEYRQVNLLREFTGKSLFSLPFDLVLLLIIYAVTLIFQLIILYALYTLRRQIHINFRRKKFDFENDPGN